MLASKYPPLTAAERGSYVAELFLAILAGNSLAKRHGVVILSAYCDESANHDRSLVSIGGAFGHPLDWIQFSAEWQKLLDEWDIPFFHMADFEAHQPPYDWPPDVHRDRLNKLLTLIRRYNFALFGSSIPREWFETCASLTSQQHWQGILGFLAQIVFITVGNAARPFLEKNDATIAYFFERGVEGWGHIEQQFNYIADRDYQESRWHLQTITRVPKIGFPPVQAADLIVYEMNKEMARQFELPGAPPRKRYPITFLEAVNPFVWSHPSQKVIRHMSEAVETGVYEAYLKRVLSGKRKAIAEIVFGSKYKPKTLQQIFEEIARDG
jgi:hypothetical protein